MSFHYLEYPLLGSETAVLPRLAAVEWPLVSEISLHERDSKAKPPHVQEWLTIEMSESYRAGSLAQKVEISYILYRCSMQLMIRCPDRRYAMCPEKFCI